MTLQTLDTGPGHRTARIFYARELVQPKPDEYVGRHRRSRLPRFLAQALATNRRAL